MNANWVNELYIGTEATTATPPVWTYAKLCKGIESMEFNENEQVGKSWILQAGISPGLLGVRKTTRG